MNILDIILILIVEGFLPRWKIIVPAIIVAAAWLFFLKKALELAIDVLTKK